MRIVRRIASVLLCLVMLDTLAVGIVMLAVRGAVSGLSAADAVDDGYTELLYGELYEALEKKTALVVVKVEDISDIITEENVREEAVAASEAVICALLGRDGAEWHYENEALYERVLSVLTAYADESGIEYENGSAETVYTALCDTVTKELEVLPIGYAEKLSPAICALMRLCDAWYIPISTYIICTLCLLLIGRRYLRGALYDAALTSFVSAFAVSCCTSILYAKDYLAETVLDDGVLGYFLRNGFNSVMRDVRTISLIPTTVFGVLGIGAVIAAALGGRKTEPDGNTPDGDTPEALSPEAPVTDGDDSKAPTPEAPAPDPDTPATE